MITNAIISIAILLGGVTPQEPRPPVKHPEAPKTAKCPQFWETALKVGWKWKDMAVLDKLMFRESRCNPTAFNRDDPMGGSRGLIQINGFWTTYLHEQGLRNGPKALFDPEMNLLAGLHIYNYGVKRHGTGWGPWNL